MPSSVEIGSLLHRLILHASAQINRYGKKTNDTMNISSSLFVDHPWLIDPNEIFKVGWFKHYMYNVMAFVSKTTPKGIEEMELRSKGWHDNLELLRNEYGGDPLNIFLQAPRNRNDLINEFCRFYGYGHKIAQLEIVWFQEFDWLDCPEWPAIKKIPAVPVDMWYSRLVRNFGIVTSWSTDHREDVARPISDFLADLCVEYEINWCDLSQALWHTGTNICRHVPKKRGRTYCYSNCPAYDFCRGRTGGALHTNNNKGFLRWQERKEHDTVLPKFQPQDPS